jgi:CheY-like chemotaxis protein/HPt (histidine-containing phosphotransfer) domain-containing protein
LSSGTLLSEDQCFVYGLGHSLLKPVRQMQLFEAIVDSLSTNKAEETAHTVLETVLPDYHDKKIMVVEDNKVNQKVILGLLAKFKISPEVADNGQVALGMMSAEKTYDLIFMDCQMPVLDGYETTMAIRKMEQEWGGARQAVVALTAHAITGEREKCVAAGMDDYLSKPIRRDRLATIMAHWLDKGGNNDSVVNAIPSDNAYSLQPIAADIWDEVATLKNLDNDKELLIDMIQMFREEMLGMIPRLKMAENQKNFVYLADVTHAIKGSVAHFCAYVITQQAAALENSARNLEAVDYNTMVNDLVSEVGRLMLTLGNYADTWHNKS